MCPRCGSADFRRSFTVGLQRWGRVLFCRKPYHCRACDHRWARIHFTPGEDRTTMIVWFVLVLGALYLAFRALAP